MKDGKLQFERFNEEDIPELTQIMKRAFDRDTQIHLGEDEGGPDGYDNGDFLRRWGLDPNSTQYKIQLDDKLIGGVILWINHSIKENYLGTIFLDPDYEEQGIGTRVWRQIEQMYPDTRVWHTETPGFSRRNHGFYVNKCGFHVIRIEHPKDWRESSYILEKKMK